MYYASSVDGFNLSYTELLPSPFNASATYPLAIELHGLTPNETTPLPGGYPTGITPATAASSTGAGFILVEPNTRTGSGFYVDSMYTGPQEQDVLDALHTEQSLRHIGRVFLFGASMGSIGALSIGLDHPNLFAGVGAFASFTDVFEALAYFNSSSTNSWPIPYLLGPTGGEWPNQSAYALSIFEHLSPLRFHPAEVRGLALYVANGADDALATNNASIWPYQQANNTLLSTTCHTAAAAGEPENCTTPLSDLRALDPANYSFRYVFEPNGPHSYFLLNSTDMFAFFSGGEPNGTFWGTYPWPTLISPPQPLVTIVTEPAACGSVALGDSTFTSGTTVALTAGSYAFRPLPCPGYVVNGVRTTDGVQFDATRSLLVVNGSGAVVVTFVIPTYPIGFNPGGGCAIVSFDNQDYSAGSQALVPIGEFWASASVCSGVSFRDWVSTGNVTVLAPNVPGTYVLVTGPGTLSVVVQIIPPPPPPAPWYLLRVAVVPSWCPGILVNGSVSEDGSTQILHAGNYSIAAASCADLGFAGWQISGATVGDSLQVVTTISIVGNASLEAVYQPLPAAVYIVHVSVNPGSCGSAVSIGALGYASGENLSLPAGMYPLTASPCLPYDRVEWITSGGVFVQSNTTVVVVANGSLQVDYLTLAPPGATTAGTSPAGTVLAVLLVVAGVVASLGLAGLLYRSRGRLPPRQEPADSSRR